MPEEVPPVPTPVIEVQTTFGGVTTDDANRCALYKPYLAPI